MKKKQPSKIDTKLKTIQINPMLHKDIKALCDDIGVDIKKFTEEALENLYQDTHTNGYLIKPSEKID